jgi:hypothetical protein
VIVVIARHRREGAKRRPGASEHLQWRDDDHELVRLGGRKLLEVQVLDDVDPRVGKSAVFPLKYWPQPVRMNTVSPFLSLTCWRFAASSRCAAVISKVAHPART